MLRLRRLGTSAIVLGLLAGASAGCLGDGQRAADPPPRAQHTRAAEPASAPSSPTTSAPPSASVSAAPTASTSPTPTGTASQDTGPAIAPSSPAISPSTGTAPRLVRYSGDGVKVSGPADAGKLRGTSRAFRSFIVARVPQGSADCGSGSITVNAWRADGFAVGDVFECPGGYRAIWGSPDGSWRELIGSQDIWSCADLRRWTVPTSIAGDKCFAHGKLEDYHQS
ncbi:MAG TPA: hypothetical protein VFL69_14470 [Marmoricola sp.]|nr:hypothetical protein [Marmoricola sp.]